MRKVTIGDCTLYNGDCRDALEAIGSIDALATDPPFGMGFQSNHRNVKHEAIANDGDTTLLHWACSLPVSHSAYVWMRWNNLVDVPMPRSLITWVKNNHSMGDLEHEHGRKTEVCAFYKGPDHFFPAGRPVDVIHATRTGNVLHPTQKPLSLMEAVVGWTAGTVVDLFLGSGTTAHACVNLGRRFVGVESNEQHFETAVRRITEAHRQADLFVDKPAYVAPVQEGLF